jgi:hypothetical protein
LEIKLVLHYYKLIGTFIGSALKNLELKEIELYELVNLIGGQNNLSKINPNYFSKLCGTTGLVVFFVKDVLDYFGITGDKKANQTRIYKMYRFIIQKNNKTKEKIKQLLNKCFN